MLLIENTTANYAITYQSAAIVLLFTFSSHHNSVETKGFEAAVNGEFYFTSLLLGFLHRLVVARKPIFRLTAHNELIVRGQRGL